METSKAEYEQKGERKKTKILPY